MNPYKSPTVESSQPASGDSDPGSWSNAKLETLSVNFGITFLIVDVLLAVSRKSVLLSDNPGAWFWLTDLQLTPILGVCGGLLSCFLLILIQSLVKRILRGNQS